MSNDSENKRKSVRLKVMEATQEDIDKGIVRIDSYAMKELGTRPGDIVLLEGHDTSVAIATRAYPADVGLGIIRMDGLSRRNAGTSLGEYVQVSVADAKPAKRVTIAPAQKGVSVRIMGQPTAIKRTLIGRPVMKGDVITLGGTGARKKTFSGSPFEDIFRMFEDDFSNRAGTPFGMSGMRFVVVSSTPRDAVLITDQTELILKSESVEMREESLPDVTYEDIGGLDEEIIKIREMVELPLKHPELFQRLGIEAPKGVLLYGPPGTGKTLLAKAVANESNAHFISLNGPEIMSKWVGEAEKKLRKVFEDASENAPTIIFIDEIDSIAPKREDVSGEVERRVVAQLLASMDGLSSRGKVIVIAATNRQNAIDPALRRPGRFDREIEFGVPDRKGRDLIFKIHTRNMPLVDDVDIDFLARTTHGFVGADVEAVCKEAAMLTLRRLLPDIKQTGFEDEDEIPSEMLEKLVVSMEDFRGALRLVQPSAMREVLIEVPNVKWEDIGGLEKVKEELKESVEWPLKYPDSFTSLGIKPPSGILLYGPPGTGKTMLAKAVANESEANFISVKGPELLSKWVGESEKGLREIFRKARQVAPAIIFFDELDSIAGRRGVEMGTKVKESMVNQLLTEMDGLEQLHDVVVIAATNRPDMIDTGLLRPGRFDKMIFTGVPDEATRLQILKTQSTAVPLAKDIDLAVYAKKTEGFSGADLNALVREAALIALREDKNAKIVSRAHFDKAFKDVNPSISNEVKDFYEDFVKRLKSLKAKQPMEASYFG